LGGIHGQLDIGYHHFKHPSQFFEKAQAATAAGQICSTNFIQPSKGKYAKTAVGGAGQCGEKGLPFGLHGGHAYSCIKVQEGEGHELFCFRNPWGHGEWTGPWGDKSDKWNDDLREVFGAKDRKDGAFFMAAEDYVQLSRNLRFFQTFGPTWQSAVCYGRFSKDPAIGKAKKSYQAAASNEISYNKSDLVEIQEVQGYWAKGVHKKTGKEGYFQRKNFNVEMPEVFAYEFSTDLGDSDKAIIAVFRENLKHAREWIVRKEDGLNYKDIRYSSGCLNVYDKHGHQVLTKSSDSRHIWAYVNCSDGPFKVYMYSQNARGKRFAMAGFAPHGTLKWTRRDNMSHSEFLHDRYH